MLKKILFYGLIAGLVAGGALSFIVLGFADSESSHSMLVGYLTMLVAFTAVFVGIKRYREIDLGGVIRFWPAFGMGVAMSVVAGILYVAAWETSLRITGTDFAGGYANTLIEQRKAEGASADELAKFTAEMEEFKTQYADPLFRLPMTFVEIFPVGVLVSLVSAGLLRNRRFLAVHRA